MADTTEINFAFQEVISFKNGFNTKGQPTLCDAKFASLTTVLNHRRIGNNV